MTLYDEEIKRLRKAAELLSQDVWAAGLFTEAADAIEKLNKRIDFLMNCIHEAEDALDRGVDNDWARAALEKAEGRQDDASNT